MRNHFRENQPQSEGVWHWMTDDGPDGCDAAQWLIGQARSNGRFGMIGTSYVGGTQHAMAMAKAPGLATVIPVDAVCNMGHQGMRNGGAFELRFWNWIHAIGAPKGSRQVRDPGTAAIFSELMENRRAYLANLPWRRGTTPLQHAPEYEDWLVEAMRHGANDDFWKQNNILDYTDLYKDIPVYLVGGWYDSWGGNTTANYMTLSKRLKSPVYLIMGPWIHGAQGSSTNLEVYHAKREDSTMNERRQTTRRGLLSAGVAVAASAALSADALPGSGKSTSAEAVAGRPVLDEVDVLVVGGGPAGIGAALGAARKGTKTLLVENHAFFGGVAAWALGMPINQVRPNGKPRSAVHELLVRKLQAYGAQAVRFGRHELWCNVEYLKVAVLDALDEAGCRYLVHPRAADAIVENNRVAGVTVATKRGLMAIRAKAVVDCTGDADVTYYAGAETMIEAAALMPMTLSLTLTNIDAAKVRYADVRDAIQKARKRLPLIPSGFLEINQVAHGHSSYIEEGDHAPRGQRPGLAGIAPRRRRGHGDERPGPEGLVASGQDRPLRRRIRCGL